MLQTRRILRIVVGITVCLPTRAFMGHCHHHFSRWNPTEMAWTTTTTRTRTKVAVETRTTSSTTTSSSSTIPLFLSSSTDTDHKYLPPELAKITKAFQFVQDDSLRHKQLLYMANQLPAITDEIKIPENKVPGCLSTVYVDATAEWDSEREDYLIYYVGDSDGLLTKGLVALLVRGLSGSTVSEIESVSPDFIQDARIGQSLTPGRNNGFLNMLAVMKTKAALVRNQAMALRETGTRENDVDIPTSRQESKVDESQDRPMYHAILNALQVLKPTEVTLVDNSDQHAGHAGSKGYNGESHFDLSIASEAFEGLNLVQRHKLIYMLLGDVMPKIHALKISAKTPQDRNQ